MKLKRISYKDKSDWCYNELLLNDRNLIVGRNASGKTKTLKSIFSILNFIIQEEKQISGDYFLEFEDEEDLYSYEIKIDTEKSLFLIKSEKLALNDKNILVRGEDGTGEIFSQEINNFLKFSIDTNIPAIYAKRDKIHHPILEKINFWCQNSMMCEFGTDLGKNQGTRDERLENLSDRYFMNANYLTRNLKYAFEKKAYGMELKERIISQMEELDYHIDNIQFEKYQGDLYGIKIMEKGIPNGVQQLEISQGMFRAFSLITHSLINLFENKVNLMMIDDIGEGLDYNRSTKLIKLLIENSEKSNSQLIMATNDRYVMNNVPLKYWHIIDRDGVNVKFYSYETNKEIFDEFEFTGLSNFDFLATKFYLNN